MADVGTQHPGRKMRPDGVVGGGGRRILTAPDLEKKVSFMPKERGGAKDTEGKAGTKL